MQIRKLIKTKWKLSKLNINFINIMKDDMSRISGFNFTPSDELDKELNQVNFKLNATIYTKVCIICLAKNIGVNQC